MQSYKNELAKFSRFKDLDGKSTSYTSGIHHWAILSQSVTPQQPIKWYIMAAANEKPDYKHTWQDVNDKLIG